MVADRKRTLDEERVAGAGDADPWRARGEFERRQDDLLGLLKNRKVGDRIRGVGIDRCGAVQAGVEDEPWWRGELSDTPGVADRDRERQVAGAAGGATCVPRQASVARGIRRWRRGARRSWILDVEVIGRVRHADGGLCSVGLGHVEGPHRRDIVAHDDRGRGRDGRDPLEHLRADRCGAQLVARRCAVLEHAIGEVRQLEGELGIATWLRSCSRDPGPPAERRSVRRGSRRGRTRAAIHPIEIEGGAGEADGGIGGVDLASLDLHVAPRVFDDDGQRGPIGCRGEAPVAATLQPRRSGGLVPAVPLTLDEHRRHRARAAVVGGAARHNSATSSHDRDRGPRQDDGVGIHVANGHLVERLGDQGWIMEHDRAGLTRAELQEHRAQWIRQVARWWRHLDDLVAPRQQIAVQGTQPV